MCGLLGVFNRNGVSESLVQRMLHDISHRGPNYQDAAYFYSGSLCLAHTRLKIQDLSDSANQPFRSACGRYVVVYNGEIYNFGELRSEFGADFQWQTTSDTEVLLAAWSRWGRDACQRLDGMFAFIILDEHEQKAHIVRDRFGIKPLYYAIKNDSWAFASEIPPLLKFLNRADPNFDTIKTYLTTGQYEHSDKTFFDGIDKVNEGEIIEISMSNDKWERSYWYNLFEHIPDLSGSSYADIETETERLIDRAISSHLVADVEVGLNVSGGVDSSMLVKKTLRTKDKAFLFNQDFAGYSELPWVNQISQGGELRVSSLGSQHILDVLTETVQSQAEPFGGVSVCAYNYTYQNAVNEGVTVLLDGNGVDEVFLGYKKYHQSYVYDCDNTIESDKRAKQFERFWGHKASKPRTGASIDGTYGLRPDVIGDKIRLANIIETPPIEAGLSQTKQAAANDLLKTKIPRGLRFNDRVSMAHSRELRVPFLDHKLVEFGFAIPEKFLLSEIGSKLIFRNILSKYSGNDVAFAQKRSVQSPQREWFSKDWKDLTTTILNSESFKDRGWVSADMAQSYYSDYLSGNDSNSFFLWQWLNLELWARAFID